MDKDFLISDLNKSRLDNAKELLRYKKKELIIPSLFIVLSFISIFIYVLISKLNLNKNGIDINTYFFSYSMPFIIFLFVFSLGISGSYYIYRRKIYLETTRFPYYFLKGVKDSFLEVWFFSVIFYLIYSIFDLLEKRMSIINPTLGLIAFIINRTIFAILFTIYIFSLTSITMYNNSFNNIIIDSTKYLFKSKKTFIIFVYGLIISLVSLYGNIILINISVVFMLISIIVSPILLLLSVGIISDIYDEYINKIEYKEFYNKGVYHD